MSVSSRTGWVMTDRKTGFILDFTFCGLRRDAIGLLQKEVFTTWKREKILRKYRPMKATQTIEI